MKRGLLFLLIVLFSAWEGFAFQQGNLVHLTTDDGLSQNLVFDMEQDSQGFIWIGTKDGLNRYDGYNFNVFRNNPSDSTSLSSNYVTYIEEDEGGNLWVETQPGGLHLYDSNSNEFLRISILEGDSNELGKAKIKSVSLNPQGGWWIGTNRGLFSINKEQTSVKKWPTSSQTKDLNIHSFLRLSSHQLLIGTYYSGIYILEEDKNQLSHPVNLNQHLKDTPLKEVFLADSEQILIIQDSLISYLSLDGKLMQSMSFNDKQSLQLDFSFTDYATGNDAYLWEISDYKLFRHNLKTGETSSESSILGISTILKDRSGILWIGTSGFGLYKYDPKTVRFGNVSTNFEETIVPEFEEESDKGLLATKEEVGKHIFGVHIDSESSWILTRNIGLFHYRANDQKFTQHLLLPPAGISYLGNGYGLILEGEEFHILYSTGVAVFSPNITFKRFYPIEKFFGGIPNRGNLPLVETLSALEIHNGYYWVGSTEYGLSAYHIATDSTRHFIYDSKNANSISSNHILSIAADPSRPNKYMWAGTDGGGLNRINIETGEVLRFTENDGLPNNVIYAIYPDSAGYLWMSSNKGIIQMDPESFDILNFTKSDGLQSDEFNRREHYQYEDGRILFCGTFGCNLFNPNEIELNPSIPSVAFTNVSVMNQNVLPFGTPWFSTTDSLKVLNVDWKENIISFEFAALEFSGSVKNKYKYRFPPFVDEWTEVGTRREISFTNLDPGFYTLEVMGSNNDGIWSDEPAKMGVKVLPPFWMTAAFRVMIIMFFSGLIAWMVWYLSRRKYREQLRKLEYKMAVDQERLRISRDMHDDLGARLTQIRMMSEFATAEATISEKMRSRFQEISTETKDVIQQFSEIVWSLNPKNDTIAGLANYMIQYSENFCRKINIPCRIQADEDFPDMSITSNVRHNLLSVLKEALNNAAKYALCTEIQLSISLQNKQFIIKITDNGTGFDLAKNKSSGQGLSSMKARMESIEGKWVIESAPETGTTVTINWSLAYHTNG